MKTRAPALFACLALLCSCSTLPKWSADDSARPPLPADTPMNKGAGNEDLLYVTLRLENGEKLLFLVDTGTSFTTLDKSLEPKLGKRFGINKNISYSLFGKVTEGVYGAPKLFLGDTQLLIDGQILTDDLSKISLYGRQVMGILGLDCLQHYCVQLDFNARKIRFLDPDNLNTNNLGNVFPITISDGDVLTSANFFEIKNTQLIVDTGCNLDAALEPRLFQQELQRQAVTANEIKIVAGKPVHLAFFDKVVFDGNVYPHFILGDCADDNLLGLRFMGRYLTTLNFPKQTMYLKPNAAEY